jgi:hypothetical protein
MDVYMDGGKIMIAVHKHGLCGVLNPKILEQSLKM